MNKKLLLTVFLSVMTVSVAGRVRIFAHIVFVDYYSIVKLHHFVKFASVQILASSLFRCRNVSESCAGHLLSPI